MLDHVSCWDATLQILCLMHEFVGSLNLAKMWLGTFLIQSACARNFENITELKCEMRELFGIQQKWCRYLSNYRGTYFNVGTSSMIRVTEDGTYYFDITKIFVFHFTLRIVCLCRFLVSIFHEPSKSCYWIEPTHFSTQTKFLHKFIRWD
jgi:hypothetical protein